MISFCYQSAVGDSFKETQSDMFVSMTILFLNKYLNIEDKFERENLFFLNQSINFNLKKARREMDQAKQNTGKKTQISMSQMLIFMVILSIFFFSFLIREKKSPKHETYHQIEPEKCTFKWNWKTYIQTCLWHPNISSTLLLLRRNSWRRQQGMKRKSFYFLLFSISS